MPTRVIDLSGQIFGDWSVQSYAGMNGRGATLFLCQCKCGNRLVSILWRNNLGLIGCIVRPRDNWVLQRIAESWLIPGATICDKPYRDADYSIYVNYALWEKVGIHYENQVKIGYFTHREEGVLGELFDRVACQMNWCIAMCDHTAKHLPHNKTTIIHSSPDKLFQKVDIVLGVCGREYHRKNLDLIPKLQKIDGIRVLQTEGKLKFYQLPNWYRSIDYLLVLSDLEGGPLPVLEALAMGKPVIAPDVGWCWDYPVIRYSGFEDLISIVKKLIVPDMYHESAQIMEVIDGICAT